jgi:hypothetical protein
MPQVLPATLDYAPSSERMPLGGLLFKPSLRSFLLLLLAALAVVWLARRHNPWRQVAEIPADVPYVREPLITDDNHLLTYDQRAGVGWFDLNNGQPIKTVLSAALVASQSTQAVFPLDGGKRILLYNTTASNWPVYDASDGRLLVRLGNPCSAPGPNYFSLSPDGTRLITTTRSKVGEFTVWNLASSRSGGPAKLLGTLPVTYAWFVHGGQRILTTNNYTNFQLLDANDLHLLFTHDFAVTVGILAGEWFPPDDRLVAFGPFPNGSPPYIGEVRSTWDGRLLTSHSSAQPGQPKWSNDLRIKIVVTTSPGRRDPNIELFDNSTGRLLKKLTGDRTWPTDFFPESTRYFANSREGAAIFDLRHDQPVAVLEFLPRGVLRPELHISPDGGSILARTRSLPRSRLFLFHPTGWDCPESHLGILIFPQTWLIILFLSAAALSLLKNANRSRSLSTLPPPRLMSTILFALALVLTLRFTLEACLGHLIYSGAPALLLCAIGLATGSRIWRFLTLAGLCATLPLYLYYLNQMRNTGLRTIQAWSLFDRIYEVPQSLPFAILLLTTVAVLAAIVQLARPRAALLQ